MKVKMYMELSTTNWDYNKDCAEGREFKSLYASSKPNNYRSDNVDLISFEVDIPDRYFKPREADAVIPEVSKATKVN